MRPLRFVLVLVLVLVLGLPSFARADTVVLRGATVLPQASPAIDDADVVIDGEKVVALGARGSVAVPAGARVIDAKGRFLIPGLIDAHAHIVNDALFCDLFLAHGVTTVRELGNRLETVKALRASVEDGDRAGPEVLFVGPIIDGNPPFWPGISEVVDDPAKVAPLLERLKKAGVVGFKVYERLTPEVYDAIVKEAKRLGVPVVGHVPQEVGALHCIESGQATIEHLDHFPWALGRKRGSGGIFDDEILGWAEVDEAKERTLIAALAKHGTKLDPTHVVIRNFSLALRGAKQPSAGLEKYVPRALKDTLWAMARGRERASAEVEALHERALARRLEFVKRAHAAGVPILAGSDTPNPYVVPGASIHDEIEELAKAIGPDGALRSATLVNASALGRQDLGRVAAGARADLVLLREDPRKDARAVAAIEAVFVRGKHLDRAALDRLLDGVAEKVRAMDGAVTAGFAAIEGELASGRKPRGEEMRLVGRLGDFPPSAWARAAEFEREGGGTLRRARTNASFPVPATIDETLELDERGELVRFSIVRTALGETREAAIARGSEGFHVKLSKNGKLVREEGAGAGPFIAPGQLLLAHVLSRIELEEGATKALSVRELDLEKLVLTEPVSRKVTREKNPVSDAKDARARARFFVVAPEDRPDVRAVRLWVGAAPAALGVEVELGFGKFQLLPVVAEREASRPAKKYY